MSELKDRSDFAEGDSEIPAAMVGSLLSFLPEDPKEAKKIFNSLPTESQLDVVLQARGKERLHYLFLSENPEELVHRLPELEVFLTVKEVGEKDSLDLISLTTPEQFQYLLDLELWKKDQLNPEKGLHWLEILLESGEERVVQFIRSNGPELIAPLLKKFLHVTTLEGDPLESRDRIPLFTLDQYYFIDFKKKDARSVFVPFLQILYRADGEGYRRLMEALIVEIESELEETGYRLRNARMADYGFPEFEEALEIYRFVNPETVVVKETSVVVKVQKEVDKGSSTFYLASRDEAPFLSSILAKTDDPQEQNRIKIEMAALCNKAMMAEPLDLFEIDEIKRVTKKVFHYLNLGLQYLSHGEEIKALEQLRSLPLGKIFQCGVGATLLLKRKAESILKGPWFSGDRENLAFLDLPHLEKFEGILRKRPMLYRDGVLDDFKNLHDFKEAKVFLESIKVTTNFLGEKLGVTPQGLRALDLTDCRPGSWQEITLSTIFLTALANQILNGTFQFKALEKARLKELISSVFERDGQAKGVIKMEIKNRLRDWLSSMEADEDKRHHLLAFKDFCLDLFEEEFGRAPQEEEIDPRFVKGLLIRT
jgi:hypothetical protein